jgi:hypothetical protein
LVTVFCLPIEAPSNSVNHSEFDNAVTKIKMIAADKPGEPHPFEIGRETAGCYFALTRNGRNLHD